MTSRPLGDETPISKIRGAAKSEAGILKHLDIIVKVLALIAIPALFAIVPFIFQSEDTGILTVLIALGALAVVQVILAVYMFRKEELINLVYHLVEDYRDSVNEDHSKICDQLDEEIQELNLRANRLKEEITVLGNSITYLTDLEGILRYWHTSWCEAVGQDGHNIVSLDNLKVVVEEMFAPIKAKLDRLFQIERGENWNFAIYAYFEGEEMLRPIWRDKAPGHPSTGEGRSWPKGGGHVGGTFMTGEDRIINDARAIKKEGADPVPAGSENGYDSDTYVSYASLLIGPIADRLEPFGVVVGTSDIPGRFNKENALVLRHFAQVLAGILYHNDTTNLFP